MAGFHPLSQCNWILLDHSVPVHKELLVIFELLKIFLLCVFTWEIERQELLKIKPWTSPRISPSLLSVIIHHSSSTGQMRRMVLLTKVCFLLLALMVLVSICIASFSFMAEMCSNCIANGHGLLDLGKYPISNISSSSISICLEDQLEKFYPYHPCAIEELRVFPTRSS